MKIWIRSSLLDEDCERRLAAKQWRKLIVEKHGYNLRNTGNHIGAAVGRAVHRVFESQLNYKRDVGRAPDRMHGIENSLNAMDAEIAEYGHINPDKTTPDRRTAANQIEQIVRNFNLGFLPYNQPKLVEERLAMYVDDDRRVMVTTTPDLLTTERKVVDFKSGAREPKAPKQVGLQAIIMEANGEEVDEGGLLWYPRTGSEPKYIPYDLDAAKDEAEEKVDRLIASFDRYIERIDSRDAVTRQKAPLAFDSNEKSTSCDPRYCGAYGTPFCPLKEKERTDGV